MKVCVRIDVKAALVAGKNYAGTRVVDFDPADLTPEQRAMLAAKTTPARPETGADLYLEYTPGPTSLIEPTVGDLVAVLDASIAAVAAEKADAEKRRKAAAEAEWQKVLTLVAAPADDLVVKDYHYQCWRVASDLASRKDLPELAAKAAEAEAEAGRRNAADAAEKAEAERQKAAEKAEAERQKAAGIAALRAWAEANGSELLKARLAGGYNWRSLAADEYADAAVKAVGLEAAECPDGYDYDSDTTHGHPTLAEMRAADAVRAAVPGADVSLIRAKYRPEHDEDGYTNPDAKPVWRTEVRVVVTTPHGDTLTRDFVVADE